MILVIGGSGSGKSAYAEKVALECQKEKRHFYFRDRTDPAGEKSRRAEEKFAHERAVRRRPFGDEWKDPV